MPTALRGDPHRLKQILTNFAFNGVKFTQRGSVVVHVTALRALAGRLTFRVDVQDTDTDTDTGIGIDQEGLGCIFADYVQADSSITRLYGGTGMGLAVSKKLVKLMGGRIGVQAGRDAARPLLLPPRTLAAANPAPRRPAQSELNRGSRFYFVMTLDLDAEAYPEGVPSFGPAHSEEARRPPGRRPPPPLASLAEAGGHTGAWWEDHDEENGGTGPRGSGGEGSGGGGGEGAGPFLPRSRRPSLTGDALALSPSSSPPSGSPIASPVAARRTPLLLPLSSLKPSPAPAALIRGGPALRLACAGRVAALPAPVGRPAAGGAPPAAVARAWAGSLGGARASVLIAHPDPNVAHVLAELVLSLGGRPYGSVQAVREASAVSHAVWKLRDGERLVLLLDASLAVPTARAWRPRVSSAVFVAMLVSPRRRAARELQAVQSRGKRGAFQDATLPKPVRLHRLAAVLAAGEAALEQRARRRPSAPLGPAPAPELAEGYAEDDEGDREASLAGPVRRPRPRAAEARVGARTGVPPTGRPRAQTPPVHMAARAMAAGAAAAVAAEFEAVGLARASPLVAAQLRSFSMNDVAAMAPGYASDGDASWSASSPRRRRGSPLSARPGHAGPSNASSASPSPLRPASPAAGQPGAGPAEDPTLDLPGGLAGLGTLATRRPSYHQQGSAGAAALEHPRVALLRAGAPLPLPHLQVAAAIEGARASERRAGNSARIVGSGAWSDRSGGSVSPTGTGSDQGRGLPPRGAGGAGEEPPAAFRRGPEGPLNLPVSRRASPVPALAPRAASAPPDAAMAPAPAAAPPPPPFQPLILVADDVDLNRKVCRALLDKAGFTRVEMAAHGLEAVEFCARRRADLVLMDVEMPVKDGLAAAREIRALEAAGAIRGRTPIVALTANSMEGSRERCLHAGMDEAIFKPIRKEDLIATIERHTAWRRPAS
eukprot:tig00000042_g15418.t1